MILLALGANLPGPYGTPEETLMRAITTIAENNIKILARSRFWISEPVPKSDQQDYRNAVLSVETHYRPKVLMQVLHDIERDFGRVRIDKNEARILDIDIIAYKNVVMAEGDFIVPHPRLHERAFVLYPLREIAPGWRHPSMGMSIAEMIDSLPYGQIIRPL